MASTAGVDRNGPDMSKRKNEQSGRGRKRKDHTESNTARTPAHKKQRRTSPLQTAPHPVESDHALATSRISAPSRSPFVILRTSLYLPLFPISQAKPLEALCAEHLSTHISTYYAPLRGVLLSYNNASLSNAAAASMTASDGPVYAKSIDEYAVSYAWVTADFLVFRPSRGTEIEGYVTLQNENHLSLLCYNQFNASIERKHLPRSWRWNGAASTGRRKHNREANSGTTDSDEHTGSFLGPEGHPVNGLLKFRAVDFEGGEHLGTNKTDGYLLIQGTLLDEGDEQNLQRVEDTRKTNKPAGGAVNEGADPG